MEGLSENTSPRHRVSADLLSGYYIMMVTVWLID